jgi:hypothetical protein
VQGLRIGEVNKALYNNYKLDKPTLLLGRSGVGKSEVVADFADSLGADMFDVRLTLYDNVDLGGLPYFDPDVKTVLRGLPDMLPKPSDRPSILFLDEINLALPSTQAAAYQLILNGCLGSWKKPDNCYVMAAGNLNSDKGATHPMAFPLLNRFNIIKVEENAEDWIDWGISKKIDSSIIGFIKYMPNKLFTFSSSTPDQSNFATARTWVDVSKYIQLQKEDYFNDSLLYQHIQGSIGEGESIEFKRYREVVNKLPNPTDIINGKYGDKVNTSDDISGYYSLIVSLIYLIEKEFDKETDNKTIRKYLDNSVIFFNDFLQEKEFTLFYISQFLRKDKDNKFQSVLKDSQYWKSITESLVKYT